MDSTALIEQTKALMVRVQAYGERTPGRSRAEGAKAQVCEFLRVYGGAKSAFLAEAQRVAGNDGYMVAMLTAILQSYAEYLAAGLSTGVSPETQAQIDVVSDILEQAASLLDETKVHAAAPIVLIGASLEEFLRTWVEREGLSTGAAKPGIDAYAKALRESEKITKQDMKDITAWAGLRNHAAHGEWDLVSDKRHASLMLQGINLFIRQHQPGGP